MASTPFSPWRIPQAVLRLFLLRQSNNYRWVPAGKVDVGFLRTRLRPRHTPPSTVRAKSSRLRADVDAVVVLSEIDYFTPSNNGTKARRSTPPTDARCAPATAPCIMMARGKVAYIEGHTEGQNLHGFPSAMKRSTIPADRALRECAIAGRCARAARSWLPPLDDDTSTCASASSPATSSRSGLHHDHDLMRFILFAAELVMHFGVSLGRVHREDQTLCGMRGGLREGPISGIR